MYHVPTELKAFIGIRRSSRECKALNNNVVSIDTTDNLVILYNGSIGVV